MEMLLDTNILVRAYNKSSPYQKGASAVIKNAMQGETEAYSISQVLYEFFAIVTNPRRVERSMLLDEAAGLCIDLWECREIEKVDTTPLAPGEVFKLVKELKLSKGRVSDCALAITAGENKLEAIYTENVDDFRNFRFIKVLNPLI